MSSTITEPGVSGGRGAWSGTACLTGETVVERAGLRPEPGGIGLSILGTGGGGGGAEVLRISSRQLTRAAGPFSSFPPVYRLILRYKCPLDTQNL